MTEATPKPWKVTRKLYDGASRPAADFTLSHQGTFVAAFANEQDAADAARAVNAHADLVAALEAVEWRSGWGTNDRRCISCDNWRKGNRGHATDCQLALALAKGRAE